MKKIYENPQMTVVLVDIDCLTASDGMGVQPDDIMDYADIFV